VALYILNKGFGLLRKEVIQPLAAILSGSYSSDGVTFLQEVRAKNGTGTKSDSASSLSSGKLPSPPCDLSTQCDAKTPSMKLAELSLQHPYSTGSTEINDRFITSVPSPIGVSLLEHIEFKTSYNYLA
jgi:hypothetical protein